MLKKEIPAALRDCIERCGGQKPEDVFYEFMERVNRVVRELEQEGERTHSFVTHVGNDMTRRIEIIAANEPDSLRMKRFVNRLDESKIEVGPRVTVLYGPATAWRLAIARALTHLAARLLRVSYRYAPEAWEPR